MKRINYSKFTHEAEQYWLWHTSHVIPPMDAGVAAEGAGSELRTPLFHFGTVLPVYLGVIRYLQSLSSTKNLKLVELGSGSGRVLSYIQTLFPEMEVWGTDYSAKCIAYAKKSYGQYGVRFVHDRAQKTSLKAGYFDFVISSHVIEHVAKKDGILFIKEAKRLLKKEGIAFIGTPERRKSQDVYTKNPTDDPALRLVPPHEHEFEYEELRDLAIRVFDKKQVKVEKLFNPVFYKIFQSSIAKFKPRPGILGTLTNYAYRGIRDNTPKNIFDTFTRIGAAYTIKSKGLTYRDILFANAIEPGTFKKISDNLLLVAEK